MLAQATMELNINLSALVARCSIWANPDVFRRVSVLRSNAVWFPDCRRASIKKGEPIKTTAEGIYLDDNSKANLAIKSAIFARPRKDCQLMHACHVWPGTCYDTRYHTSLANLVLLPAPLSGFSDHDERIAAILRYRSYELFGWHPSEVGAPAWPESYPEIWAPPIPIDAVVLRRIERLSPIK